ncbi:hypothetical protein K439DRAFT_202494 [Ramaria rubella]|nr:hypothetical protein K439DRAFT_202494 [Ramaria rubella]
MDRWRISHPRRNGCRVRWVFLRSGGTVNGCGRSCRRESIVRHSAATIMHLLMAFQLESVQIFHPEWRRGLNQLGNTCYLNSLLQVCFSIRTTRNHSDSRSCCP